VRPSNAMEWAGGAQAFSVKRGCYLWRDPQPSECPACRQGAGRFVLTDPDEPWNGSDHLLFFHCFEHVLAYMPACPTPSSHPERLVLALALAFRVAGISQPGAEVGILEPGRTCINNPRSSSMVAPTSSPSCCKSLVAGRKSLFAAIHRRDWIW
jgi:hypothetical protein